MPVHFDEQIMPGALEYTIHYLVEEKIDITPLETRFQNNFTGAPAYNPKVLLKIVLLAYSRGVISSRRIERLCRADIVFKALTAGTEPDFTTIAGFIRGIEGEEQLLFSDILLYCNELDLLGGTTFALDGCKLSSNASKEYSGTFNDLKKKKEKLAKTVKFLMARHRENDRRDKYAPRGKRGALRGYNRRSGRLTPSWLKIRQS